jgi:restriction system protein
MLPLLKVAADGQEHRFGDAIGRLADEFNLTEDERKQPLPSGPQPVFSNRVGWAKTYLVQAGLLEATKRAHFKITNRGQKILAEPPMRIDNDYLSRFPEYVQFRERGRNTNGEESVNANKNTLPISVETPDEIIRSTTKQIESALRKELLSRVLASPPAFFENLIVKLLRGMGYGGSREDAGRAVGRSGDGGIDGVIDQDALGLDRVYIQAKRYALDNPVGEPDIRAFSGSIGAAKANKGVFVTTSYFTEPAQRFVERAPHTIVLIDGEHLATLMIRHNVGARSAETLYLKKVDEDFFSDE